MKKTRILEPSSRALGYIKCGLFQTTINPLVIYLLVHIGLIRLSVCKVDNRNGSTQKEQNVIHFGDIETIKTKQRTTDKVFLRDAL